jgi:hypothetical protein
MRLTRRGWIVLFIFILALVVLFTWATSGINVACDLRNLSDGCGLQRLSGN